MPESSRCRDGGEGLPELRHRRSRPKAGRWVRLHGGGSASGGSGAGGGAGCIPRSRSNPGPRIPEPGQRCSPERRWLLFGAPESPLTP